MRPKNIAISKMFFCVSGAPGANMKLKSDVFGARNGTKIEPEAEKQNLSDMLHPTRLLIKIKVFASQNRGEIEKKAGRKAFGGRLCTGRRF